MKVVFRVDASINIGSGHVMRCLTLAQALKSKGDDVAFICRSHKGNLNSFIESKGFHVYVLNSVQIKVISNRDTNLYHSNWLGVTQIEDATQTVRLLADIKPSWLVVDHYAIDEKWHKKIKKICKKLMVIDDIADRKHYCDVLLDQNFGSTASKYLNLVEGDCKILAGSEYAILRPEFKSLRASSVKRREKNIQVKNILVSLGGVDLDNYTEQVLKQLDLTNLSPNVRVVVVLGKTSPHLIGIQSFDFNRLKNVIVKVDVSNMAELMFEADLAIGAAGATSWERCCLGLPTIQIVIAENQKAIAQNLSKEGAVKLINEPNEIPNLINNYSDWILDVKYKTSSIVDGLGAARVLEELVV